MDAKANTPESRARPAAERDRIDTQIAELRMARDRLDAIIAPAVAPESGCQFVPA